MNLHLGWDAPSVRISTLFRHRSGQFHWSITFGQIKEFTKSSAQKRNSSKKAGKMQMMCFLEEIRLRIFPQPNNPAAAVGINEPEEDITNEEANKEAEGSNVVAVNKEVVVDLLELAILLDIWEEVANSADELQQPRTGHYGFISCSSLERRACFPHVYSYSRKNAARRMRMLSATRISVPLLKKALFTWLLKSQLLD
jgi:hypothetical protein